MSSVDPLTAPTVSSGDGYADARAIDMLFAIIERRINDLIIAMGEARQADDTLTDGVARWRNFSEQARNEIREMVGQMAVLRAQLVTATDLPANGDGYTLVDEGDGSAPYFTGVTASPTSTTWTYTMPGETGAPFIARLRVRHYSELTPFGLPSTDVTNPYIPMNRWAQVGVGLNDADHIIGNAAGMIPLPGTIAQDGTVFSSTAIALAGCYPYALARVRQTGSVTKTWILNGVVCATSPGDTIDDQTDTPLQDENGAAFTVGGDAGVGQFGPSSVDKTLEIAVQAGDVITITYDVPDGDAAFTAKTDYPEDDDRFPYTPRYREAGAFQFDWLSFQAS